jgi:hypothetical protein
VRARICPGILLTGGIQLSFGRPPFALCTCHMCLSASCTASSGMRGKGKVYQGGAPQGRISTYIATILPEFQY